MKPNNRRRGREKVRAKATRKAIPPEVREWIRATSLEVKRQPMGDGRDSVRGRKLGDLG